MTGPALDRRGADALADALGEALGPRVERDASLARFSTYRLGGPAAVFVDAGDDADLDAIGRALAGAGHPPVLVVGRGSNLLVADAGFPGLALRLTGDFDTVTVNGATADAGGAVALPRLARQCAAAGRAGLEFYVGIPGSVGGAVRMNAGGHGRETSEVLEFAVVVDLATGERREQGPAELDLGYRHSGLGPYHVVTRARFGVVEDDPADCGARIDEIVRWRREHQPGGSNAGSVFTNPPGDSAGRIIDACGLKGHRVGNAVVSDKHANFFQAEPGATADDVYRLVADVRQRVEAETGVRLEPELTLIGFATASPGDA